MSQHKTATSKLFLVNKGMTMTDLVDKAKWRLARELARNRLPVHHNDDIYQVRAERWNNLAKEALPDTEALINAMTLLEFLKLLNEILEMEE